MSRSRARGNPSSWSNSIFAAKRSAPIVAIDICSGLGRNISEGLWSVVRLHIVFSASSLLRAAFPSESSRLNNTTGILPAAKASCCGTSDRYLTATARWMSFSCSREVTFGFVLKVLSSESPGGAHHGGAQHSSDIAVVAEVLRFI